MNHANFSIVGEGTDRLLIRDEGPWDKHPSITNDAEWVVEELACRLFGRRLFYIDSDSQTDELVVKDGRFAGFRPGPMPEGELR
jgi:hypothetical protein